MPGVSLSVHALRGIELESAMDVAAGIKDPDERQIAIFPAIINKALLADRRSMPDGDWLGMLDADEFDELSTQTFAALAIISPTFTRSDVDKWSNALSKGAEHPSNLQESTLIGRCTDENGERPDRYFGGALADLTDGQLMAYRASVELVTKIRRSNANKPKGIGI